MKKRIGGEIGALVIILCTFIIWQIAQIGDMTYATAVGTVTVSGSLNVRKGPGKKYAFLKSGSNRIALEDGTKVTILAQNKKWYKIRFRHAGKKVSGYVYAKYLSVLSGDVCTHISGIVSPSGVIVRTRAIKNGCVMKKNGTNVKLARKKKVQILSETMVASVKYYQVSFTYNKERLTGYIPAKSVVTDFSSSIPGIITTSGQVTLKKTAGKTVPVQIKGQAIAMMDGTQVMLTGEKTVSGVKYFSVDVEVNAKTYHGYVAANLVRFQQVKVEAAETPKPTEMPDETPGPKTTPWTRPTVPPGESDTKSDTSSNDVSTLSDKQFKKLLVKEGFPSSYITQLMKLHAKYPKWQFKAYQTGLDWADAIANESKVGYNLISNSKSKEWKSTEAGAYDAENDRFIPFDGSTWVTASEKAVKYYMDPRNFMDEKGIFQFESLEYQSGSQTQKGVENVLKNTPMYQKSYTYTDDNGVGQTITYSKTFMDAAKESGVNPYHLASRVKQEVVTGPNSMSSSVSGTVSGYAGIYNFYNIGAGNSTAAGGAVASGLAWASKDTTYCRPWNTIYKAIVGGARYIGGNYINVGQNTLYLQKFNVTSSNTYNHQYMANIEAPNSEGIKTASAYGSEVTSMKLVFSIPVYKGMPASASPVPTAVVDTNNYLKALSVKGHAFTNAFQQGDDGSRTYMLTVENNVKKVKITASQVSAAAKVTGTGTKKLKVGTRTYTVKVTAQSGKVRKYKIKITRKSAVKVKKTAAR